MKLYSTNNKNNIVDLKKAVLQSLPEDKGLYMPISIPKLPPSFFKTLYDKTFNQIAFEVSHHLIDNYIPENDLLSIVEHAFDFEAKLIGLGNDIYSLELWHGPSLAFKDFGARYMAQLMSYFNKKEKKKITVLVATSGDTGGAVASGFYNTDGIEVIILYPSGKVSPLQEKQLTTWGGNIHAIEVNGSFDDCQTMVKAAFLDKELNSKYNLSSANSINIARLIPQSFYYFDALRQLGPTSSKVVVSVPSGNFGNLTAGAFAQKMGLQIDHFIAATNKNRIVPEYLKSGNFIPKASVPTLSNAMDVGNPSNFPRLLSCYGSTWNTIRESISGFHLNDDQTIKAMLEAYRSYGYICDPHGAIGFQSILSHKMNNNCIGIFLETAHPAKFLETVEDVYRFKIDLPKSLLDIKSKDKVAQYLNNDYSLFKDYLMQR